MPLYLVRHAKAGSRTEWAGDDTERPLSPKGWHQANALAKAFNDVPVTRVLSSPYRRCIETVQPLADAHGLKVEHAPELAEGETFEPVLELLRTLPDHSVLCSHGDIVPDVIDALARRGMTIIGDPDWRKGARWELERDDDGAIVSSRAVPPPS